MHFGFIHGKGRARLFCLRIFQGDQQSAAAAGQGAIYGLHITLTHFCRQRDQSSAIINTRAIAQQRGIHEMCIRDRVEGVVVGHHSVIGMGVFLGQSTRIYNRATREVSYGYVPPGSVVVSGSLPAEDGSHSLYCAVIVKQVDEKTRSKTSINDLLRGLAD